MLALTNPALPILVTGVVLTTGQVALTAQLTRIEARHALHAGTLSILLLVAGGFGVVARLWHGPAHLMSSAGPWAAARIGAGLADVVNNIPAAVLLSSTPCTIRSRCSSDWTWNRISS